MKKINIAFLIDDLCSLCGLTANLLENIKRMDKDRFNLFVYVLNGSKIIKEFRELKDVEIRKTRFYKLNPFSFLRIIKFLKSDNIEIMHNYPFVSNLIGPLLAKIAGIGKIITSIHSQTIIRSAILRRLSYNLSDEIIVVSEYLREFLKEKQILDNSKVKVIHNGIDLEFFKPENIKIIDRREIDISGNALIVMTISKFRREKGYEYLIKAIAKIKDEDKFRFVFIGDGPLEAKIKSMAKDFGVEEKILFMGYKDSVYQLLSLCDIFVLPSVSEGFGISLLEAMAMEKPVITTAVGGIPEVARDGRNALFVKSANPDAILNALYKLADDKLLRQKMGKEGRRIARKNFDSRDKVNELERLYLGITV